MLALVFRLTFAVRPSTVYDIIRRRLGEIIPLNKLLGIEIISIDDGVAEARLPFRAEVTNHLGTAHATAIFGLAEATSGYAMSGAFAPVILRIRPIAASASVNFSKIARSDLVASARTGKPAEDLRAELAAAGRVVFDVLVDVRDDAGRDVAQITVAWHVTKK
jgi:uncharacterized protein (TIGR00369 family)